MAFCLSDYRDLCEHFEHLLSIDLKEHELFQGRKDSKNLGNIITLKEKVLDEDDSGVKLLRVMKDAAI